MDELKLKKAKGMQANVLSSSYKKILLCFFIVFLNQLRVEAQTLSPNNWYFGNTSNGIKFNRSDNKATAVTNKATPFGIGGSSVATDAADADLLFYTDGSVVYDACHLLMQKGSGLNANTSGNQPTAICPIPGQSSKYYIFTNSANFTTGGTVSFSVVDLSLFGNAIFPAPALGDVESKNNPTGIVTTSEGMITVPHANGTDFWLITHKNGTAEYDATLINAATYPSGTFTVQKTTLSGSLSGGLPLSVANFSVSPKIDTAKAKKNIRKIAVAPQTSNTNALILNFDNSTGTFTFDSYIFNTGKTTVASQEIYDIEWDKNGQYLYLSYFGDAGITPDVLQYDYTNPNNTLTSVLPVGLKPSQSLGLQVGPDNMMYYLYQAGGKYVLGNLTKTDTIAAGVKFKAQAFGALDYKGMQFPSFLPKANVNLKVSFSYVGSCQNNATTFYPAVSPNADSLTWDFGDKKGGSSKWSPVYTYANAGSYSVHVRAYYQGQIKDTIQAVTIKAFNLQIKLVSDTTACRSEFPPKRGTATPVQFSVKATVSGVSATTSNWSNGQTGLILKPDSAGYYYLTVGDGSGCFTSAGVNVKEYGLSDQRRNKWYFGNKAGIDFNFSPPKALNDSGMDAPEGCAIVCDRNGETIFYTDGNTVYDRTNVATANGTGIGGSPTDASTQSSLIFQVPGDETLYYIFTTQAIGETGSNNELRYSLFDWKLNNGKGDISKKNVLLFSKTTERITANANWLVVHEYGNNTFRSYKITQNGISEPVYSSIGSDHSFKYVGNGEGYMKIGPNNTLAVPLSSTVSNVGSNFIELFHLNDSTGHIVKFDKNDANNRIDLQETSGEVYGLEFASSTHHGTKLYATIKNGASSKLAEIAIDSLNKVTLLPKIATPGGELGAIQTSPTGEIYVSVNPAGSLAVINPGSDLLKSSNISADGFQLATGTNSLLGLPNFIRQTSNGFGGPSFTYTGVCIGDSTKFTATPTDAIDKFKWSFGDGTVPKTQTASVSHLYAKAGTYTVTVEIYNRCYKPGPPRLPLDTILTASVPVYDPPAKPSLVSTTLCKGPVTLDANKPNTAGLSYSWSTGDTTKTITVTKDLIVSVTNTDVHGCSSKAQAIVAKNPIQLDLGPDQTVCQNNAVNVLDALNPGATYQWTVNGVKGSTIEQQAVDTTTPGVTTYGVTVTDPITTCSVTDQIKITVNVSPDFTLSGTNPSGCKLPDGTFVVTLNSTTPTGGPYSYFITGPNSFNKQDLDKTAPNVFTFGGQSAGTFSAIVTDQISGCTISKTYALTDAPWTVTSTATVCDPSTVTVNVTGSPTLPLTYTFTGLKSTITSKTNPTTKIPADTYTVTATDAGGCTSADPAPLVIAPNPTVTITPDNLCNLTTLTASVASGGPYTYSWNFIPTSLSGPPVNVGSSPIVNVGGVGDYIVSVSTVSCTFTQKYTVASTAIVPSFTASDPCKDQVILTASPSGNYSYTWQKIGSGQPDLIGQQVLLNIGDDGNYTTTVKDLTTGCIYKSAQKAVSIVGAITATLTSTPPCQDGKAFTLTATATSASKPTFSYQWLLNGKDLGVAPTASTTNQTSEGNYQVVVSVGSCKATTSTTITRFPVPVGSLPTGAIICDDPDNKDPLTAKVDLDPGSFTLYNWFKNDLIVPGGYTKEVYTATSAGVYRVDITNPFGCIASDSTNVRNECIPKLVAPNAFRPGSSSSENKNFFALTFFITDPFEVIVFNRWGEIVFESKDKNFKWNGNYNNTGTALPPGTYAYVFKFVSSFRPDLGIQEQRGGVVLIR